MRMVGLRDRQTDERTDRRAATNAYCGQLVDDRKISNFKVCNTTNNGWMLTDG